MHLRFRLPALMAVLALASQSLGCATTGGPAVGLRPPVVDLIQPAPSEGGTTDEERFPNIALRMRVIFDIENPLPLVVTLPAATASLTGTPLTADPPADPVTFASVEATVLEGDPVLGQPDKFTIPPRGRGALQYEFLILLLAPEMATLLGHEVEVAFVAEGETNLPQLIRDQIEGNLTDQAVEKIESTPFLLPAIDEAEARVTALLPAPFSDGTLRLAFETKLKFPRLPEIQRSSTHSPRVDVLGAQARSAAVETLLAAGRETTETVLASIDAALDTTLGATSQITLRSALTTLGVPSNLVGGAIGALNGFAGTDIDVDAPIVASSEGTTIAALLGIEDAWATFAEGVRALVSLAEGPIYFPTELPQGLRIVLPFVLNNTNHFDITVPELRSGLQLGSGEPAVSFWVVSTEDPALPSDALTGATASTVVKEAWFKQLPDAAENVGFVVGSRRSVSMVLVSEVVWQAAGTGLMEVVEDGTLAGNVTLGGDVTVDLGYGPITLPFPP